MTLRQADEYARAVYDAVLAPPTYTKESKRIAVRDTPKYRFGRVGPGTLGVHYGPGQRPKAVVSDHSTPDRERASDLERGELTETEFKRQASAFSLRGYGVTVEYMTHPRIIADIRVWLLGARAVKGRYRTAREAAESLQRYLRNRRWPVSVPAALTERLFRLSGFEKSGYGWAVAFRCG